MVSIKFFCWFLFCIENVRHIFKISSSISNINGSFSSPSGIPLKDITGSIIVYVLIWWIIFFSVLPLGIQSNKEKFRERIEGIDPGAPNNPKIAKKFLITTIITSIIFIVIYYLVEFDLLNLRKYLQ